MNKKIIISLSVIAAVAAIAVGGTIAFFTDTETSTGNTFTAGAIDLKIDSQCSYNSVAGDQCGVWGQQEGGLDIVDETFFNFTDVKPGDEGENTISLHVINNEAYGCLYISPLVNDDNDCTEPELKADDTCVENDITTDGELAQEINFFAWADDGDNIWENGELPLFSNVSGPASDVLDGKSYSLGILPGDETKYIGIQWCFGDMTVDTSAETIVCDGSVVGNASQTDSMSAGIAFSVEQTRNNPNGATCDANPFVQ